MRCLALLVIALAGLCVPAGAGAQEKLTTLYAFKGAPDASGPLGNIAMDRKGDIFGASWYGGAGYGAVFELFPPAPRKTAWTETVVWNFPVPDDGDMPTGGIIRGPSGILYGTASLTRYSGCGSVFQLTQVNAVWNFLPLHQFQGAPNDGCQPSAALTLDSRGIIYGNTDVGGTNDNGTVFTIAPARSGAPATETVIWNFDSAVDGAAPNSQMILDAAGNLYGTSPYGGPDGDGTVWELTPPLHGSTAWTRTVLWIFDRADCFEPTRGPLVFDGTGALYGTCHFGGPANGGVVFKLTPPQAGGTGWTETTVYSFGESDGNPTSGVVLAVDGSLIGATGQDLGSIYSNGSIYSLSPPVAGQTVWTKKTLWLFTGNDGFDPESPVVIGPHGALFGTTLLGGGAQGTAWKLAP